MAHFGVTLHCSKLIKQIIEKMLSTVKNDVLVQSWTKHFVDFFTF